MKILLISSTDENLETSLPQVPPLNLLYIASYIRCHGFSNIKVIDANFSDEKKEIEKEIQKADIIGVSAMTAQINYAYKIAGLCKKYGKMSIIGGCHATVEDKRILEDSAFDIVVRSEGEITFLELLNSIENKRNWKNVIGISYKNTKGEVIRNVDRDFINDIDSIPFPAIDLINIKRYVFVNEYFVTPAATIITSRGCPYSCIFCCSPQTWRRRLRLRSAKNIFEEILEYHNKYGLDFFHFPDDFVTASRERIIDLCNLIINSNINIRWSCVTRPNLDLALLKLMKKGGCIRIAIGVESASRRLLERAKKNYTTRETYKSVRAARRVGIITNAYFIVGLPGETIWTYLHTLIFAILLRSNDYQWAIFIPFPGTEAYTKNLVEIIERDYTKWDYFTPVVRVGDLSPLKLNLMKEFAYIATSFPFRYWNRYVNKLRRNFFGLTPSEKLKKESWILYKK